MGQAKPINGETQRPEMLFIGCVDARLPLKQLGIPRNAALIERRIAALVFHKDTQRQGEAEMLKKAVDSGVKHIVVMGHTDCGGIRAVLEQAEGLDAVRDYLAPFADKLRKVQNATGGGEHAQARAMEEAAVSMSLENLRSYDFIQKAVDDGKLELHGWVMDVRDNKLHVVEGRYKGKELPNLPEQPDIIDGVCCQCGTTHKKAPDEKFPAHEPTWLMMGNNNTDVLAEDLGMQGKVLVHRHSGTPDPLSEAATLEFAIKAKGVENIAVMRATREEVQDALQHLRDKYAFVEKSGAKLHGWIMDKARRDVWELTQNGGRRRIHSDIGGGAHAR